MNPSAIGGILQTAYTWGTAVAISFTAASLAILLISFIYSKS